MALAKLMDEGFGRVAVLSLHVIPGIEFHDLYANAQLFSQMSGGLERVSVAWPLLSSHEDMVQVATTLLKKSPRAESLRTSFFSWGTAARTSFRCHLCGHELSL